MEAYSTAGVRKKEKIEYWQHLCSRTYADLKLSARDHSSFEGELRRSSAGPLSFVSVRSSAACITRTEEHVIDSPGHRFEIFLTRRGASVCDHNGRRSILRPGDFALVDISLPYRFEFEDTCSAASIGVPKALLATCLPVPGAYVGRHMPGTTGVNRLASVMIDCLCEQVSTGQAGELTASAVRGVLDVIAAAFGAVPCLPMAESTRAASRRVQIRAYIEAHLRDPQLTPRNIAAALGLSPRYLRLLFAQEEETISRYVLRRRLEEATRDVIDPRWGGATITDIAYHWGFGDAARFTRAFREQHGVSPRCYRLTRSPRD